MESRGKAIKKRLNSFSGWKTVLGVLVLLFFVDGLVRLSREIVHVEIHEPVWIALIPVLTLLAWWLEFAKWRLAFAKSDRMMEALYSSFKKGMLTGFITPAALGNFVGRIASFEKEQREHLLTHTLFGNGAQFLASIGLGLIGLTLYHRFFLFSVPPLFYWIIYFILLVLFFRLRKVSFFKWKMDVSGISLSTRSLLLGWSFLRGMVFISQFSILLFVFTGHFLWGYLPMVALFYLFTTLSPSVFVGKLIVRESIALWLFPILGIGGLNALVATIVLWLFNNGLSSLWALNSLKKKVAHA